MLELILTSRFLHTTCNFPTTTTTTTPPNMMSDDSSELSSVPSEDETDLQLTKKDGILKFFSKAPRPSAKPTIEASPSRSPSPPRPKRAPSPPHEYVLADNPDIAFIIMFRSRFTEAFPKSLAHFGPQELERDVVDTVPGEHGEHFLCALLGLLLNRKQDVKAGHYNRALEEAIATHKSQWAKDWESKNPLSGGATFASMSPTQRLTLLRTLILWSLSSSDAIKGIINASYKQSRHEDDLNQPLSVQPWGSDGSRRRYYLIEGLDDTHFRVYRESCHISGERTWWSVAGDINELKQLAEKLANEDGGQKARLLSSKMMAAIPRFEATEEKRKRREYRQTRKQQFKRPEPGFSLYEGRTRGKRIKYTYSDEEDEESTDATTSRRSTRNTGTHTPSEGLGVPTVTQSGRQVKARQGGTYGETVLSGTTATAGADGANDYFEDEDDVNGRPRRAAAVANDRKPKGGRHIEGYNNVDEMTSEDEDDASEHDYGDDEDEEDNISFASDADGQDELSDDDDEMEGGIKEAHGNGLLAKLPVKTPTPEKKTFIKLHVSPEKDRSSKAPSPAQPSELSSTNNLAKAPSVSEDATKPIDIQPKSPRAPQAPLSPRSPLAFRGSPEKPPAFTPSINVG
ncbi:Uncharacterized protein BP5553_06974 [Venustampulla echinocandica]|uniref:WHIM1 domain-containing protein n=1 Tax=Venustampulla echinocandica TaxID=2656787 RepID=A0A370TI58_9HELO|nr:Uncharacterized protein BP5553_06974 [Venustampulla echinocandica]RDL35043.1 Uncharacterized protein BP5553_06974 [Venustampulla echinocandica]